MCSRLSSSRRTGAALHSRRYSFNNWTKGRPPVSRMPTASASAAGTINVSLMEPRPTKWTRPAKSPESSRPISRASRVFPDPPAPVSVTSRTAGSRSSCWTAASSRSRPNNGVRGTGSGEPRSKVSEPAAAGCVKERLLSEVVGTDGSGENVASARNRFQNLLGTVAQRAAQFDHALHQRVIGDKRLRPENANQLLLRHQASGIPHQVIECVINFGTQPHLVAGLQERAAPKIQREVAKLKSGQVFRSFGFGHSVSPKLTVIGGLALANGSLETPFWLFFGFPSLLAAALALPCNQPRFR